MIRLSNADRTRMADEREEMQYDECCSDRERAGLQTDIDKLRSGRPVAFNDVSESVVYL